MYSVNGDEWPNADVICLEVDMAKPIYTAGDASGAIGCVIMPIIICGWIWFKLSFWWGIAWSLLWLSLGAWAMNWNWNEDKPSKDFEPSKRTGGMVVDAIDESGINLGQVANQSNGENMPFDEKLRRLHKLQEDGLITVEEYEREKQIILKEG